MIRNHIVLNSLTINRNDYSVKSKGFWKENEPLNLFRTFFKGQFKFSYPA